MGFIKVLIDNLFHGPATDPFPFGDTYTPDRLRARVELNPDLCMGCGTCIHVCAAGAVKMTRKPDGSGFELLIWRNTCCLCGQCAFYCPTNAVTISNNWHNAHRNTEKYTWVTSCSVTYDTCAGCGSKMRFLPQSVIDKIYAGHDEVDIDRVSHLCPNCRMLEAAVEEERACYIDHLKNLLDEGKACDIDFLNQLEEAGRACNIDNLKKFISSGTAARLAHEKAREESAQAASLTRTETKSEASDRKTPDTEHIDRAQPIDQNLLQQG